MQIPVVLSVQVLALPCGQTTSNSMLTTSQLSSVGVSNWGTSLNQDGSRLRGNVPGIILGIMGVSKHWAQMGMILRIIGKLI